ncbi:MAG TPA: sigma-70 family RNA polymerase sigma factor [Cytophagales bacterium]|nr:sigma-70 family RNA polymerase sigma factor [Cytophagales bacterium]
MQAGEFNHIVDEYSNRLCRFADKMLRNREQAKDIVQDVLTKLWEHRGRVDPQKIKSWLFTVTYRRCLEVLEKSSRMVYDHDFTSFHHEPNTNDLKGVLTHSLDLLTDVQKSILLLRDYEGYSYEEIGDILQLSESQVKVYLFRARQKMKEYLKDINLVM